MFRFLAVDDDPTALEIAKLAAAESGSTEIRSASSAAEAFAALEAESFDIVFLDLGLSDRNGSSLLSDVITAGRGALVAVVTADDRPATIVECMKRGAFDYVTKPMSPMRLRAIIGHVRSMADLKLEVRILGGEGGNPARDPAFSRILTRSPLMLGLFKTIERIAQSPLAVLVAG
jgi:DNA-binding NtrC family response regulator